MAEEIRLLLVDDDAPTRNVYGEFLRESGFTVVEAKDGVEALERAAEQAPDIVFTGIAMPRMDGFTLVESLRKNVVTARTPVVFLSHLGREDDRKRAEEAKVNDFIVRDTTSPREVVARLKAQLSANSYILGIDPKNYDGQKFAKDLGLHPDFLCATGEGTRYVLRIKKTDPQGKHYSAELICV